MKHKIIFFLLSVLLLGNTYAGDKLTPNKTFQNPDKQLTVGDTKRFKTSDTILVPGIMLHTLVEGRHGQSSGGAHAKAKYAVSNLSPQLGEELATEIHSDLVTKLKASGWKVLTYDDTKDHKGWAKIKTAANFKETGTPGFSENYGFGPQTWMTSYPKNAIKLEINRGGIPQLYPIQGKVTKDLEVNLLYPVYRFDSPVAWASTDKGYKSSTASAGVLPAMNLIQINPGFLNHKGAWGYIDLKGVQRVSENVGTITMVDQSSSSNLSLFTFETFRTISKGDYLMTLDEAEYRKTILQVATDYNSLLVEALESARSK